MRESWRRQGDELNEARVANALVEHEAAGRERANVEAELPPGRTNTERGYVPVNTPIGPHH